MDQRPIGIFDSGIGGLTVVKEVLKIMPNESIIYFGDTARVPYGTHSAETIQKYARQDLSFLLEKNVKAVLVACGTISATSLSTLRKMTDVPIMGVIEPASNAVLKFGNNVLVLATKATISSHAYKKTIVHLNPSANVYEEACPLFVPLVENGYTNSDNMLVKIAVSDYLSKYKETEIDSVILGCTHYPLLKVAIKNELQGPTIIEAGREAAYQLKNLLDEKNINADSDNLVKNEYYVSDISDSFTSVCESFLEARIEFVRKHSMD